MLGWQRQITSLFFHQLCLHIDGSTYAESPSSQLLVLFWKYSFSLLLSVTTVSNHNVNNNNNHNSDINSNRKKIPHT